MYPCDGMSWFFFSTENQSRVITKWFWGIWMRICPDGSYASILYANIDATDCTLCGAGFYCIDGPCFDGTISHWMHCLYISCIPAGWASNDDHTECVNFTYPSGYVVFSTYPDVCELCSEEKKERIDHCIQMLVEGKNFELPSLPKAREDSKILEAIPISRTKRGAAWEMKQPIFFLQLFKCVKKNDLVDCFITWNCFQNNNGWLCVSSISTKRVYQKKLERLSKSLLLFQFLIEKVLQCQHIDSKREDQKKQN